jgi:Ras-related GTP-binding protein C/D
MITGLPKCGKSTIKRVVFQSQEPSGSLILDAGGVSSDGGTAVVALNSFVQLQISTNGGSWGEIESLSVPALAEVCSVIFVVDLMSDYLAAIAELYRLVLHVESLGLRPRFDIFLHKCDGLEPKARAEVLDEISRQVGEELGNRVQLQFFLTSLYDCSILHAMSLVVQRHLSSVSKLVDILDKTCDQLVCERGFLFDVVSRIFLASNSRPFDVTTYELCSEALDLVEDMAVIYQSQSSPERCPFAKLDLQGIDVQNLSVIYFGIGHGLSVVLVSKSSALYEPSQSLLSMGSEIISVLYP